MFKAALKVMGDAYASPLGGVRAPVVLHGNGPAGKRLLAKLAAELEAAGWPPPGG